MPLSSMLKRYLTHLITHRGTSLSESKRRLQQNQMLPCPNSTQIVRGSSIFSLLGIYWNPSSPNAQREPQRNLNYPLHCFQRLPGWMTSSSIVSWRNSTMRFVKKSVWINGNEQKWHKPEIDVRYNFDELSLSLFRHDAATWREALA